jgi:hypothetical protein
MAERRGPNRRKKAARRKARRRSVFARALPVLCIAAACVAAGMTVNNRYGAHLAVIAERMNEIRDPSIDRVVVQGSFSVNVDELLRNSGVTLPVTADKLKKEYLKKMTAANPWIEKVRCIGAKKGMATLQVSERRPIALVQLGSVWLVDEAGICMPLKRGVSYECPLVSGLRDSVGGDGIRRLKAFDARRLALLCEEIDKCDSAFARTVAQLNFGGDGRVCMTLCGTPTAIFIGENAPAQGLERLTRIWNMVATGRRFPRSIDCSYRNIAFVSPAVTVHPAGATKTGTRKNKG